MSTATPARRIGALLLAAGVGRRFGSDKREARLADGTPMLEAALGTLRACCDEVIVVVGAADSEPAFAARCPGARVVRAPRSGGGMGYSLADGIAHAGDWDACLVALADKPFVRADSVRQVRELLATHDLVVPTHGGAWGHPVGFARRLFPVLAQLAGDAGARGLIVAERERAWFVELDDPGVLTDVDTPTDLMGSESN